MPEYLFFFLFILAVKVTSASLLHFCLTVPARNVQVRLGFPGATHVAVALLYVQISDCSALVLPHLSDKGKFSNLGVTIKLMGRKS